MQALYPRMMQIYGRKNDPKKIEHYLMFLTQAMSGGVTILIGVIYFFIGKIVLYFLSAYSPAIGVIQIVLLGSSFLTLAMGANAFLVAINNQKHVLYIQIAVIGIQSFIIITLAYLGASLHEIAKGMVFTYFLYAAVSLFFAGGIFDGSMKGGLLLSARSLSIILFMLCSLVIIHFYQVSLSNTIISISFFFIIWILTSLPVLIFIYKRNFGGYKLFG